MVRVIQLLGIRLVETGSERLYLHECGPRNESHVCNYAYGAGKCCRCLGESKPCRACRAGRTVDLDDFQTWLVLLTLGNWGK